MDNKFIVIAGNIASGKTSLAKILSKKLNIEMFEEPVQSNPYLDQFYEWIEKASKNPNDKEIKKKVQYFSYAVQEYYLLHRTTDHHQIINSKKTIVQDRSIYEDKEIFAKLNYELGNINKQDYKKYIEIYNLISENLHPPDVLIYIENNNISNLKKRLKLRGNKYEQGLTTKEDNYLKQLSYKYQDFANNYYKSPIHTIKGDELDFVNNVFHQNEIVSKIKNILEVKR